MAGGKDDELVDFGLDGAAQRVDFVDGLDFVAKEADPVSAVALVCGEDFDGVAADTEGRAVEVVLVALVLYARELSQVCVA